MRSLPQVRVVVSFRAARSRLGRFLTGSIAVHGALMAAVLVVPATRHNVAPIEDTMVVALAGPMASAPAPRVGPPAPQAPEPAPALAPAPKEAHTVRKVPILKPKEKPAKATESPTPTPPAAPTAADQPSPHNAKPAAVSGAVTATLGGGDTSLGWYGAAVKAALESVWAKPYLEDEHETASVVVTFDIARDGTTRNIRILQSSGIPSLDRSAQRAVIEASPLPAIPPTWTEEAIPVTMRFDLSPETR